ncbi:MAG: hypothetical protein JWM27_1015 [Gemmatimonadetes bacterium]|nr:hypothetical protein [Gemmatimonadota bacterium]
MDLESCLPANLRGPATTINRIGIGQSGAGVYRVDAAGEAYVLKIAAAEEPAAGWLGKLHVQQLASDAGLAPRIVHADEKRRAVVSAFVTDRSFPALYGNPGTREAALAQLGRVLRRVHELPLPADAEAKDPRELLAATSSSLAESIALPALVAEAVGRVMQEEPPPGGRAAVLSHNDVNPTNLAFDGEALLLLDWDTAGPNEPFYDLATISVFLRMDEETCGRLLAAYDGEPVSTLPDRFAYDRRLVAALCGAAFLNLARLCGHTDATGTETSEATPSLGEVYQQLRSGSLSLDTAEGRWGFGLALMKGSLSL